MRPAHVLLDADGVLQTLPGGWRAALSPYLGARSEEFVTALAMDEQACLTGEPFLPVLGALLARFDVAASAAEVHAAAWERIEVDAAVLEIASALRAAGTTVHLATNQNPERATYMRRALAYDDALDGAFYSSEVGLAKPDPAYFRHCVAALGAEPGQVLFVDDSARNVDGAAAAGLQAFRWQIGDGYDVLRERLGLS